MFNRPDNIATYCVRIALSVLLAVISLPLPAQEAAPLQSVLGRPRPNYDPLGTRIGIFDLDASVGIGIGYSDNIFAASRIELDDFLTVLDPSIRISTDWGRAALAISAEMSIGRHAEFSSEDFDDHMIGLDWLRRLGSDGTFRLGARTVSGHDSRREPTDEDGLEPNKYNLDSIGMGLDGPVGALDFALNLESRDIDYLDTPGRDTIINNDDRDRRENWLSIRVGILSQRVLSPFFELNVDERDYEQATDDHGVARSSDGSAVGIGIRVQHSGKLDGELLLGRIHRSYQDDQFPDLDRLWLRSLIEWNPTGLTTVTLNYQSGIEETTFGTIAGFELDEIGLQLDHELMRNLVFSLGVRSAREKYVSSDRDDDISIWFAEATYFLNNHLRISLEFQANQRDSSVPSQSFTENIYGIVLRSAL